MTDRELKTLKDNLWHAADVLRSGAHLAANKYGQPILGLIFLRYADILFKQHKDEIDAEYTKRLGTRMEKTSKEIAVEKCGFFLPECAYYDFINDAPDTAEKADLVKKAMEAIERENPKMEGVLPKEVYAQLVPEEEPELLSNIVRIFKDIPENCTVDIFGEIYEYFLGNFALAEGKDGGTFYTPATVVRYMVEVLDPQPGDKKFLDPACGSGGMFVQAARDMHAHNANEAEQMKFRCYGVEKEPDTVKLAKMNLLLNNVRGDITEANSFYSDPYNAFGAFDYVMANPPFNLKKYAEYGGFETDSRWQGYGVPPTSNANYAWILHILNKLNVSRGIAGFLLANGALDDSDTLEIRKLLIESDKVEAIIVLPRNMFYSTDISVTLWILNNNKKGGPWHGRQLRNRTGEILFIDLRTWNSNIYEKKYVRLTEADIDRVRQIYFNWQTENFVEYAEPELYYAAHRDEIQGKGYSLVPSRYIEFIDRDTEIDYQSALSEMSDKFNALKKRWDANETELVNAFKILGYGKE